MPPAEPPTQQNFERLIAAAESQPHHVRGIELGLQPLGPLSRGEVAALGALLLGQVLTQLHESFQPALLPVGQLQAGRHGQGVACKAQQHWQQG
jgi:hypothetical protein